MAWQEDGLCEPESVRKATAEYRSDMDIMGQFLADCCNAQKAATTKARTLYNAYKDWCADNGRKHIITQTAFGNEMTSRGYAKKRTSSGQVYQGLEVIP